MRRSAILLATLAPFFIVGCSTPEAERQQAIAQAEAHCNGEGKQFVLGNVEQKGVINWGKYTTIVSGHCLGSGDPGYVPAPTTRAN